MAQLRGLAINVFTDNNQKEISYMKKNKFIFLLILTSLLLSGCGAGDNTVKYTVSFDTDGGNVIENQTVKEGERVKKPQAPVKKYGTFNYWELISGTVKNDTVKEYVNGEEVNWSETYLGNDDGPYLAYSDLSFKANWKMDNKKIIFWFGQRLKDYNYDRILSSLWKNHEYFDSFELIYQYSSGLLDNSILLQEEVSGNGPYFAIDYIEKYLGEGRNPFESIYFDREEDKQQRIKAVYLPVPAENKSFVESNFDKSKYESLLIGDELYGMPLFDFDTIRYDYNTSTDYPMHRYYFLTFCIEYTYSSNDKHDFCSSFANEIATYFKNNATA